jgi:hypothetical protein
MRLATKQHRRRISSRAGLTGALIITCILSAPLSAQSTAATALSVGQRVRIVPWEGAPPVVGTLIARRSDSLIVGRGKDTVGVERNDMTHLVLPELFGFPG